MKLSTSDYSPRFPTSTPPARPGAYFWYYGEEKGPLAFPYHYWDGKQWTGPGETPEEAEQWSTVAEDDAPYIASMKGCVWAGLTQKAHDKIHASLCHQGEEGKKKSKKKP